MKRFFFNVKPRPGFADWQGNCYIDATKLHTALYRLGLKMDKSCKCVGLTIKLLHVGQLVKPKVVFG